MTGRVSTQITRERSLAIKILIMKTEKGKLFGGAKLNRFLKSYWDNTRHRWRRGARRQWDRSFGCACQVNLLKFNRHLEKPVDHA